MKRIAVSFLSFTVPSQGKRICDVVLEIEDSKFAETVCSTFKDGIDVDGSAITNPALKFFI